MEDKKTTGTIPEIKDADLNEVAGGYRPIETTGSATPKICQRCGGELPANSVYDYCKSCLDYFKESGVSFFV